MPALAGGTRSADARPATPPAAASRRIDIPIRRIVSLGLVAGLIDALSYIDLRGIYTGAMTGNTVQFGLSLARGEWSRFALVAVTLAAFFCGGLLSSLIRRHLARPPTELAIMAGLMVAAQSVRLWVPHPITIELPLLAIAMAMQGETISRFGGMSIQTIVVTNNMLKCADAIVGFCHARGSGQRDGTHWGEIALPGSAWLSYVVGAGAGAVANSVFALPFLLPAALLAATTADQLLTRSDADEAHG